MFGLKLADCTDDSMTVRPGNRLSPCGNWQFELMKVRMAELVAGFAAICMEMGEQLPPPDAHKDAHEKVAP
jgi:hypothetical protein